MGRSVCFSMSHVGGITDWRSRIRPVRAGPGGKLSRGELEKNGGEMVAGVVGEGRLKQKDRHIWNQHVCLQEKCRWGWGQRVGLCFLSNCSAPDCS